MPDTVEPISCGRHRMRSEGKLILVEFVGRLEADEFQVMRTFCERVIHEQGYAYLLAHVQKSGGMSPEVRHELGPWFKRIQFRAVANIGANLAARSLATLLTNGLRLIYGIDHPMAFHKDEAEARKWVDELERTQDAAR